VFLRDIKGAGDNHAIWVSLAADATLHQIHEGHPHQEGEVHWQWKHYGGRQLQCSDIEEATQEIQRPWERDNPLHHREWISKEGSHWLRGKHQLDAPVNVYKN